MSPEGFEPPIYSLLRQSVEGCRLICPKRQTRKSMICRVQARLRAPGAEDGTFDGKALNRYQFEPMYKRDLQRILQPLPLGRLGLESLTRYLRTIDHSAYFSSAISWISKHYINIMDFEHIKEIFKNRPNFNTYMSP